MRWLARRKVTARLVGCAIALLGLGLLLAAGASPAFAQAWWRMSSRPAPTLLTPGKQATIVISATNVGDTGVNANTSPVTITDSLPAGLEATEIRGELASNNEASHLMSCELGTLRCTSQPETLLAFERLDVIIAVNVKPGASTGEEDEASVRGGEQEDLPGVPVPGQSIGEPITLSGQPTPFGVEEDGTRSPPKKKAAPSTRRPARTRFS